MLGSVRTRASKIGFRGTPVIQLPPKKKYPALARTGYLHFDIVYPVD
jgi:hypothetical protein